MLVSDELIKTLEIKFVDAKIYYRPIRIDGSQELITITSSLNFFSISDMLYIASGVLDRQGIDINETGFRYPSDELDPGEEPLKGVKIYNPTFGKVQLNISTFENLMCRYFRAIIVETEKQNSNLKEKSWWSKFIEITEQIEQRLKQKP